MTDDTVVCITDPDTARRRLVERVKAAADKWP